MLDYQARQIIAARTIEDRHAEARRSHLLREVRGSDSVVVTSPVDAGPSVVDRLLDSLASIKIPLSGRLAFR